MTAVIGGVVNHMLKSVAKRVFLVFKRTKKISVLKGEQKCLPGGLENCPALPKAFEFSDVARIGAGRR